MLTVEVLTNRSALCPNRFKFLFFLYSFFSFLCTLPDNAFAQVYTRNPQEVCDQAAQIAADRSGVPVTVLQAITRTETGRKRNGHFGPWPWTVNMEGRGVWFDSLDEARAYVFKNFKRGARSFDIGCFQINYKWHHQNFSSIDEMFDPQENANYAALFLKSLYKELGDWSEAAGAYHSRTPKHANRYRQIFEKHRAKAPGEIQLATTASPAAPTRKNAFPLLKGESSAQLGSLMPIGTSVIHGRFIQLADSKE
ncbi:transglycosylase SLT domain-containing protein [Rhodalgimonas zhirmunskyi]|uniref:Transglycosylase SLT domain-containing protein n=1 Tax=Rhodalgimonas zhirmunskyi TaxID=2964767 RepID=A0AAJ1U6K5_9RHOB|nr:transglycosylase SLT domain-containing protein [Rhodoalgimonas zhirmunskyi]MDQ2093980.1 transglycosylase SLT domain-containing protein [Rhodoalgimonas zhirmunskyi]